MGAALGALGGGGGGLSASSSASTGPQKSGDIGGSQFNFGGINTGTQSTLPTWAIPVIVGVAGLVAIVYFLRRK